MPHTLPREKYNIVGAAADLFQGGRQLRGMDGWRALILFVGFLF